MTSILIATHNRHKVEEIQAVLGPAVCVLALRDFPGAPEIPETGATFAENAQLKAVGIARWLQSLPSPPTSTPGLLPTPAPLPWAVLADDSGLEVDALQGAPGVHSARFASNDFALSGNAPDGANNARLLQRLADIPEPRRTARFRCVLALVLLGDDPSIHFAQGVCEGRIGFLPRGHHGFGYDPIFFPLGFSQTLAQLGAETKNHISHRAAALHALRQLPVLEPLLSRSPA